LLESWKEIARYLNRDVRTAQRWERTRDLPVHRLPGSQKSAVYASIPELEAWRSAADPPNSPASIAVLPFDNLSGDQCSGFFADGLADRIIAALTENAGLRVCNRTSSFAFRGAARDAHKIGAALRVNSLLIGSVFRLGDRLRVSVQLADVNSRFDLWAECYDSAGRDWFAFQDDISHAIANAAHRKLVAETRFSTRTPSTAPP
jgi:adenylate cyclase